MKSIPYFQNLFLTMSLKLSVVNKENIDHVRMILNSVLPVSYPSSFYKQIGKTSRLSSVFNIFIPSVTERYTGYVAIKSDKVVGCIIWETLEDRSRHLLALGKDEERVSMY